MERVNEGMKEGVPPPWHCLILISTWDEIAGTSEGRKEGVPPPWHCLILISTWDDRLHL